MIFTSILCFLLCVINVSNSLKCLKPFRPISSMKMSDNDRPPIIPFDGSEFMRDDVPIQKMMEPNVIREKVEKKEIPPIIRPNQNPDDMRPTSYDTNIEDPDDIDEIPPYVVDEGSVPDVNDNEIIKLLKSTYITSPYDSRNKKQAKFVVRSITLISLAIGLVFTVIWYAFPGKFISYRQDTDFTQRYPTVYLDPDSLLQESQSVTGMVPFDDNIEPSKMDRENSIERFAPEKKDNILAKPTVVL